MIQHQRLIQLRDLLSLSSTDFMFHSHLNRPRALELTAVGENTVMDNLEVFRKNGFQFEIDDKGMLTYQLLWNWIFCL